MAPRSSIDTGTLDQTVFFYHDTMQIDNNSPASRQSLQHESQGQKLGAFQRDKPFQPSFSSFPETEEITMWRNPLYTLKYFGLAVCGLLPKQWPWTVQTTARAAVSTMAILCLYYQGKIGALDSGDSATIQKSCLWMQSSLIETLFWIGCGVLSTIGMGSGVQTGALFLFPHVCRLALAWSKQQQVVGSEAAPSLAALIWSVAIPGFWSGGGSAVGELVPFLLARVIRKSGKDPFALLITGIPSKTTSFDKQDTLSTLCLSESHASFSSTESIPDTVVDICSSAESSSSWWTPQLLLSNTRETMESQLSSNAFWKIFTLAVVPNALFDLAGLVCGASSDVSVWEFFLATWFAKAIIRTPAQTCALAMAVVAIASPGSLPIGGTTGITKTAAELAEASDVTATLKGFLEKWGRLALAKFVGDDEFLIDQQPGDDVVLESSQLFVFEAVKVLWTSVTVALFGFFIISSIEQVAQHYVRTNPDPQKIYEGGRRLKTA